MSSVITEVAVQVFKTEARTSVDSYGHRHPGPSVPATGALLRITDSDGVSGYVLGKPNYLRQDQVEQHFRPVLIGSDPLAREAMDKKFAIRQRTRASNFPSTVAATWTRHCGTWQATSSTRRCGSCSAVRAPRSRRMPAPCAATTSKAASPPRRTTRTSRSR